MADPYMVSPLSPLRRKISAREVAASSFSPGERHRIGYGCWSRGLS